MMPTNYLMNVLLEYLTAVSVYCEQHPASFGQYQHSIAYMANAQDNPDVTICGITSIN